MAPSNSGRVAFHPPGSSLKTMDMQSLARASRRSPPSWPTDALRVVAGVSLAAVLAASAACSPRPAVKLNGNSHTRSGIVAYLDGHPRNAERLLRGALAHNPQDTLALYYLAHAYMARGTPEGRLAAQDALAGLNRIADRQPRYLRMLADLRLEQGFVFNARETMNRLAEVTPDDPDLWYRLGRLAEKDWWRFQAREDIERTMQYYRRALSLEGAHRLARTRLAVLAFESDSLPGARAHVMDLLAHHPHDGETRMLEGILSEYEGNYTDAERIFRNIVADLPPYDRPVFLDPVFLRPDSLTIWDSLEEAVPDFGGDDGAKELSDEVRPIEFDGTYWRQHDPSPATGVNERFVVHVSRMLMADFLYGDPSRGTRGWATAPGEFYVRYGKPLARRYEIGEADALPHWVHAFDVGGGIVNVDFVDYALRGEFMLPIRYGVPLRARLRYGRPENAHLEERLPRMPVLHRTAWFRDERGEPRLEIAMGAPGGARGCEIAIVDTAWAEVYRASELLESRSLPEEISGSALRLYATTLYPGRDGARLQVTLKEDGRIDAELDPPLPPDGFALSDLVLGVGAGAGFVPNPGLPYPRGATVGVRFEVYDVMLEATGYGYLTITMAVIPEEGRRKGLSSLVLGKGQAPYVRSEFEDEVSVRTWARSIEIDTSDLEPGTYRIEITVKDKTSGRSAARQAALAIVPR